MADYKSKDARDRSQTYREGGFIEKAVEKYKDKRRIKGLKKSLKGPNTPEGHKKQKRELAYLNQKVKKPTNKITSIVKPKPKPKKKGLKPAVVPSNPPLIKGDTTKEKIKNVGKKAADLIKMNLVVGLSKAPKKAKGKKK